MAEGERVQASKVLNAARQQRWREKHNVTSHPVTSRNVTSQVSLSSSTSSLLPTSKIEESKKERAVRSRKSALPDDWKPNEAHYAKAAKFGMPADLMLIKADDMRNWAKSKAIIRADWDATFHGFLRPKEGQSNGFGGSRPLQDDSKSVSKAADRLIEATEQGRFTVAPRPSLLPAESQSNLRLLPKR